MRVMVREGLFSDGEPPVLLASRCTVCGNVLFPRVDGCTYCAADDPDPVELTGPGTLWSWTAVTAAPPGYQGKVPFGVGVVELSEGVRIIGRLTESDPSALAADQPMELRVVTLHTDEDGNDVVTYAFAPAGAAGEKP
jgi:uncharacterized OB-fold protein